MQVPTQKDVIRAPFYLNAQKEKLNKLSKPQLIEKVLFLQFLYQKLWSSRLEMCHYYKEYLSVKRQAILLSKLSEWTIEKEQRNH